MSIVFESNRGHSDIMFLKQFAHVVFAESHGVISNVDFKGCPKSQKVILKSRTEINNDLKPRLLFKMPRKFGDKSLKKFRPLIDER